MANKRDGAENKRNKIIYSITEEGRRYLKEWLQIPAEREEMLMIHTNIICLQ